MPASSDDPRDGERSVVPTVTALGSLDIPIRRAPAMMVEIIDTSGDDLTGFDSETSEPETSEWEATGSADIARADGALPAEASALHSSGEPAAVSLTETDAFSSEASPAFVSEDFAEFPPEEPTLFLPAQSAVGPAEHLVADLELQSVADPHSTDALESESLAPLPPLLPLPALPYANGLDKRTSRRLARSPRVWFAGALVAAAVIAVVAIPFGPGWSGTTDGPASQVASERDATGTPLSRSPGALAPSAGEGTAAAPNPPGATSVAPLTQSTPLPAPAPPPLVSPLPPRPQDPGDDARAAVTEARASAPPGRAAAAPATPASAAPPRTALGTAASASAARAATVPSPGTTTAVLPPPAGRASATPATVTRGLTTPPATPPTSQPPAASATASGTTPATSRTTPTPGPTATGRGVTSPPSRASAPFIPLTDPRSTIQPDRPVASASPPAAGGTAGAGAAAPGVETTAVFLAEEPLVPETVAPPRAAAPPAPAPAASPPLAAAPTAVAASAAATQGINATLNRYRDAFATFDVGAAKAVWPSVNERALSRAFATLDEQQIELNDCDIAVAGQRADASCTGVVRYVAKVGTKTMRVQRRSWKFALRNNDSAWVIENVVTR